MVEEYCFLMLEKMSLPASSSGSHGAPSKARASQGRLTALLAQHGPVHETTSDLISKCLGLAALTDYLQLGEEEGAGAADTLVDLVLSCSYNR